MGPDEVHDPYCGACEIARANYIELEKVVDDLALLVRRLAIQIKRINPDNDLSSKAMDYLSRNNLAGSHIREEELLEHCGKVKK